MNSVEKELQKLSAKPAPNTLDQRVAETLQAHASEHCGVFSVRIPIWACATACLAFFAVGMLVRDTPMHPNAAPPAPVVCSIDGGPAFAAAFAAELPPDDYFLRKKRQINSQTTKGDT